jgi:hypothetical protein
MTKSGKQIRILYTNGKDTYVLYSLSHTGIDLYYSASDSHKYSYHASGVKHTKTADGKYLDRNKEAPLKEVSFRQLHCVGFVNSNKRFSEKSPLKKASGKKVDGSLIIDSRSIPEGISCDVNIGLISPDNLQMLYNMLHVNLLLPNLPPRKPQQVFLYTAQIPWIYVILSY